MTTELKPIFIEFIPDEINEGELYISTEYNTCTHLCPCGCKERIPIPINNPNIESWDLSIGDGLVTISPSLQNRFKCKSHYFIRENKIVWC